MKSKSKNGFFGIFKKKTTPAPEVPQETNNNDDEISRNIDEKGEAEVNSISSVVSQLVAETVVEDSGTNEGSIQEIDEPPMAQPRKSSIAKTSVLHYSPPGTFRFQPTNVAKNATSSSSSCTSSGIERKSNIVLDDEASVVATPISHYDDVEIIQQQKKRKKRTAAPPPPDPSQTIQTSAQPKNRNEAPKPPPHGVKKEEKDVEEMFKNFKNKFDEWHAIRMEEMGSVREETIKAQVVREHDELRKLLESDAPVDKLKEDKKQKYSKTTQQIPLRIPNFYQPVHKNGREKVSPSPKSISPKSVDENRNEVTKKENSIAVERLRKEVEEQRQREKEIKQYRNPADMNEVSVVEQKRMIEYKPMKVANVTIEDDVPPPIPNNPPPKLSDYRNDYQPRLPTTTVSQNGYVRLAVGSNSNGYKPSTNNGKSATNGKPRIRNSVSPVPAPVYASSPQLLRKSPAPVSPAPKKETIYQRVNGNHNQNGNGNARSPPTSVKTIYQSHVSEPRQPVATSSNPQNTVYQKVTGLKVTSPIRREPSPSPRPPPTVYQNRKIENSTSLGNGVGTEQKKPTRVLPPAPLSTSPPLNPNKKIVSSTPSPPPPPPSFTPKSTTLISMGSSVSPPSSKIYQKSIVKPAAPSSDYSSRSNLQKVAVSVKSSSVNGVSEKKDFEISDVLKGAKLRKVGMPVERNGISMGKVLDSNPTSSQKSSEQSSGSLPPPPPPPPPTFTAQTSVSSSITTPNPNTASMKDNLMHEIREAGRLRAARALQASSSS